MKLFNSHLSSAVWLKVFVSLTNVHAVTKVLIKIMSVIKNTVCILYNSFNT